MPHKAVYSQPFKQNICITRICSFIRINLGQIYYEYFSCSFEHQQRYRNVSYHFGIGRYRPSKCSIPIILSSLVLLRLHEMFCVVQYGIVQFTGILLQCRSQSQGTFPVSTALHCTALNYIVLYYTVLLFLCSVLYHTILYKTFCTITTI